MLEDSASLWASMATWFTPTVLFLLLNLVIGTIAVSSRLAAKKKPHAATATNHHDHDHHQQHFFSSSVPLERSPSMLHRLKSINFYSNRSQEPTANLHKPQEPDPNFAFSFNQYSQGEEQRSNFARSPSLLQRLKSIKIYGYVVSQPLPEPVQQALEPATPPRDERERFDGLADAGSLDEIYSKLKGGHVVRSVSEPAIETAPAPAVERRGRRMKKSMSVKVPKVADAAEALEARRPMTVREAKRREEEDGDGDGDGEVDAKADDFINKFKQQLKLQRLDSILRGRK